jgi:hypothetical protein
MSQWVLNLLQIEHPEEEESSILHGFPEEIQDLL